jgi:hypothetical protein
LLRMLAVAATSSAATDLVGAAGCRFPTTGWLLH